MMVSSNENFLIILFKNKIKKRIIKKFKTQGHALNYYSNLISESDKITFNKQYENGNKCNYELALLEKSDGSFYPLFTKDDMGRQVKVTLLDDKYSITKISNYNIDEHIIDYSTKRKITLDTFIKKYLSGNGYKLISKLNNKIILQIEDDFKLFTLKNVDDCDRFMDVLTDKFIKESRLDVLLVKDYTTSQRKYLYELLTEKGFPKDYLLRHSTTHPVKI